MYGHGITGLGSRIQRDSVAPDARICQLVRWWPFALGVQLPPGLGAPYSSMLPLRASSLHAPPPSDVWRKREMGAVKEGGRWDGRVVVDGGWLASLSKAAQRRKAPRAAASRCRLGAVCLTREGTVEDGGV